MSDNTNKGELLQRILDLQSERDALESQVESLKSKSINQQASAWSAVYDFVRKFVPEFSIMKGSGKEQVIAAIDGLIKRNRELSKLINPHHLAAHDAEVAKAAFIAGYKLGMPAPLHNVVGHAENYVKLLSKVKS